MARHPRLLGAAVAERRGMLSTNYRPGLTPGHVQFDSLVERRQLFLVDFDPTVAKAASQPMRLQYPDGNSHIPDLFLRMSHGAAVVVDVKPSDRLAGALRAVRHDQAHLRGARVAVPRPHRARADAFGNVELLSSCRFPNDGLAANSRAILRVAGEGPRPLADLVAALSGLGADAEVRPQVLHLLWTGALTYPGRSATTPPCGCRSPARRR